MKRIFDASPESQRRRTTVTPPKLQSLTTGQMPKQIWGIWHHTNQCWIGLDGAYHVTFTKADADRYIANEIIGGADEAIPIRIYPR